LFPTRGALGPGLGPGAPGFGPAGVAGRAAGAGADDAAGAAGVAGADSAGADGVAAGRAGAGVGRAGVGVAAGASCTGCSTGAAGAAEADAAGVGRGVGLGPGRGPPGLAPVLGLGALSARPLADAESDFSDGNDSRRRRATGASTVDDADLTNSPCSLSRASSSLLVTPSSFANSCTRALPATALLTERPSEAWCPHDLGLSPMDVHRWCFTVCSSVLLPVLLDGCSSVALFFEYQPCHRRRIHGSRYS
jgi:hypothetical protein